MQITSIENYKCLTNRVLIEIESRYNDRIKFGENDFYLDTSYEPEMHTVCKGRITAVCDKLRTGKMSNDMEWQTTVNVKPGDEVYFSWMAVDRAFNDQTYFVLANDIGELKKRVVHIPAFYSDLTLAVVGEEIIMLNGYILIQALAFEDLPPEIQGCKTTLILTGKARKKESTSWGRVVRVGEANSSYVNPTYSDNCAVAEGDIVLFAKDSDIAVQYDLHADLLGKQKLFKIQRRYLLAKIESSAKIEA
jgi:co-chaperonin GroES (HSP10)